MPRSVAFKSNGLNCSGLYFVPQGLQANERRPTVVMAHGFSAVKEMLIPVAEHFVGAGMVTLIFDYRFLGTSEGEPRGRIFPAEQIEDYRNAITWVSMQPEVDPDRIGIWGTSYSGGHVLQIGAYDKRVKAVVSQVPAIDVWATGKEINTPPGFQGLLEFLRQDRVRRYSEGDAGRLPIVAPPGEPCLLPDDESRAFFTKAGADFPTWLNETTMESVERFLEYFPASRVDLISPAAVLFVPARNDILASATLTLQAYERALQPKGLEMVPGGHFHVYEEPGLSQASRAATDWFKRYL